MTNPTIREKVISYLVDADDKKVKAFYALCEDEIEQAYQFELTPAQIKRLDSEREKHLRGETPSYSWDEIKENLLEKIRKN